MPDLFTPQREADFLQHVQAFAQSIAADPDRYMVSHPAAKTLMQAVDAYAHALNIATNKAMRTEVTVNQKNTARNALEDLYRLLASQIRVNAGISDSDKISLGLHVAKTTHTPRVVPQTSPLLGFQYATPGIHHLTYRDSFSPNSRARPFGAIALQLYVAIGDEFEPNHKKAVYYGGFTKPRFEVKHEKCNAKKTATYFGRWVGARQDVGPWSLPLQMDIMFGGEVIDKHQHADGEDDLKLAA